MVRSRQEMCWLVYLIIEKVRGEHEYGRQDFLELFG